MAEGIEVRHRRGENPCPAHTGGRCSCQPTYRPYVYDKRAGRKIRPSEPFKSEAAAKAWRQDALVGVRKGTVRSFEPVTVAQAAEKFMAGVRDETIISNKGGVYRASTIRVMSDSLQKYILPRLGDYRLAELRHTDVQAFVDEMTANGAAANTVNSTLLPLRNIYRRAIKRGEVGINPVSGVTGGRRTDFESRFATPAEAAALIKILPTPVMRAMWGVMFYGGLRKGEMLALRWDDVEFAANRLRVERSWDERGRVFNAPKTKKGKRIVPLLAPLRPLLLDYRMDEAKAGRDRDAGLVFNLLSWWGSEDAYRTRGGVKVDDPAEKPVAMNTFTRTSYLVWADAGLERVNPHGARHTFASVAIAAMGAAGRFDPKMIQDAMGHSSITMTYDRYGHLFPGRDADLGKMMDDYIAAQLDEAIRIQQLDE